MTKTAPRKVSSKKMCIYCGSRKKLTRDHIPPKSLFAKPLPNDLITVPCCRNCNNSVSKDDEYFRSAIVLRRDAGEHPEAKKVAERVWRSLQRPEAQGLNTLLLNDVREFYRLNELGIYEPAASYYVEFQRIESVASRIVKGLFWDEYGKRLSDDYVVSAFIDSDIGHMDDNQLEIFNSVLEVRSRSVGKTVFRYWQRAVPEDESMTAWILLFYGSVWFVCFTVPKSWDSRE